MMNTFYWMRTIGLVGASTKTWNKKINTSSWSWRRWNIIAQTTGVSLISSFGGDKELREVCLCPFSLLQGRFSRFLLCLDKANFISALRHMVPPILHNSPSQRTEATSSVYCASAITGFIKNVSPGRQQGKRQLQMQDHTIIWGRWDENLVWFYHIHTSTYGETNLSCPVWSWQAVMCDSSYLPPALRFSVINTRNKKDALAEDCLFFHLQVDRDRYWSCGKTLLQSNPSCTATGSTFAIMNSATSSTPGIGTQIFLFLIKFNVTIHMQIQGQSLQRSLQHVTYNNMNVKLWRLFF